MADRKGRRGLLSPKRGDEASYILTSDPNLQERPRNPSRRPRKPCEICSLPRDGPEDADKLRLSYNGTKIRACRICIDQAEATRNQREKQDPSLGPDATKADLIDYYRYWFLEELPESRSSVKNDEEQEVKANKAPRNA